MTRVVAAGLEAGENVKIWWRNIRNSHFDWILAIEEHEEGDLCSSAFRAVEGENITPASQDDKWFRFSMPKDGKIKISSSGDNKAALFTGNCEYDRLSGTYYPIVNPERGSLKNGEIVFIKWVNLTGEAFIWNLSVEDNQPGENCNLAVNAVEGENQLPESFKGSFWYKFIMPEEGYLNISSEVSNSFWVWKGSECGNQNFVNFGVGSIVTGTIPEGETVYLNWEGIDGHSFIWNLSIEEVSPGGNCELAFTATEGENHMPQSSSDQWFSFTLPRDGKLKVQSSFSGSLYKGSCEEKLYVKSLDGTSKIPGLKTGETVYFHWRSDWRMAEHEFNYWNISVEENEEGDLCNMAISAAEGENYFPATNDEMWYQFTMPKDGRIEITSSAFFTYSLFSGTCENNELTQQFHRQLTAGGLTAGETYLIKVSRFVGAPMIWNLAVEDNQAGDHCGLAHTAVLGDNVVPAGSADQWFLFTMPSEGILAVNYKGYQWAEIFTGDCQNLITKGQSWSGIKIQDIAPGEHVYFKWDARTGNRFSWNISVESPEGADCETTITAAEGTNAVVASGFAEQWYSFTMPVNGHLSVSNTESRQLSLYEGICGALNFISAGIGNTSAQDLTQNTTYFIKAETFRDKGYDFNITVTLQKESQSISFSKITDQLLSSGSLTLSATATSGLAVEFEVTAGSAAVSGNILTFNTAGEVTVKAKQPGNTAFLEAEPVSHTFCVNPDKPVITAENGAEMTPGVVLVSNNPIGNQWFRGGVKIEGAVNATIKTAEPGIYTVQVSQGSCTGMVSDGAEVKKGSQTISLPLVEADKIVAGEPFIIGGTSSSGLPLRYEIESGAASLTEDGNLIIQGPGPVTLVAYQDGNSSFETAEAARITFCVPPAKAEISVEKETSSLMGTLVSNSSEGNQWLKDGKIIEGATGQNYPLTEEGSYSVQVNIGGCLGPVSESVMITGFGKNLPATAMKVFPNPTSGKVVVEFSSKKGTEAIKVKLVNAGGTEIFLPVQIKTLQGHKSAELDLSSLSAGIYYVLISDGETMIRSKVFKK